MLGTILKPIPEVAEVEIVVAAVKEGEFLKEHQPAKQKL